MNPDDLARILDELGRRLGPTGEYVFALAVRQVYINAAVSAIVAVGLALVGYRLWRWSSSMTHMMADWDRPMVRLIAAITFGLAVAVALLGVPAALNPEYTAIRDILGVIR